jgi:hypothetical protein
VLIDGTPEIVQLVFVGSRASRVVWPAGAGLVGSGASGAGSGDGVCGLWLRCCDRAAGTYRPGLSPVPVPRLRQVVQRAQRRAAEPRPVPIQCYRPRGAVATALPTYPT